MHWNVADMISLDTNVLLRRILNDDVLQARKANQLFSQAISILITDIALVETVWTLTGKRYNATKETIAAIITSLLAEPNVVFESKQAVWAALQDYLHTPLAATGSGARSVGYADALLINKSKQISAAWGLSYDGTYTFDQAAQTLTGVKAP